MARDLAHRRRAPSNLEAHSRTLAEKESARTIKCPPGTFAPGATLAQGLPKLIPVRAAALRNSCSLPRCALFVVGRNAELSRNGLSPPIPSSVPGWTDPGLPSLAVDAGAGLAASAGGSVAGSGASAAAPGAGLFSAGTPLARLPNPCTTRQGQGQDESQVNLVPRYAAASTRVIPPAQR
eukprot:scaffold213372_cov24-Tisochrysis_lutea.AAC.1